MKITVIGTGYVGLVTGACLAEQGNHVFCLDLNQEKIDILNAGGVPIYEPGLKEIIERNLAYGRLIFSTDVSVAVAYGDIQFIAVGTPPSEDGSADLSYIIGVANELGKLITDYKVIVDKSTVPVGTAAKVHAAIAKNYSGEFDVVSNPEFLREGVAVDDFMKPDRVVIGSSSDRAKKLMGDLFAPFVRQGNPVIYMDEASAELTKYAANSFLATKISFMNEIAQLCERMGADVDMVRRGIGSDDRIGKRFLFSGIGYGGSCFPKDVQALIKSAASHDYDFKILNAVERVNEKQKMHIVHVLKNHFNGSLAGKHFALWGLAFKPNTDDIREAPALTIIQALIESGATVAAFDPEATSHVKGVIGDSISYAPNQYAALENADALIIATEWSVFRTPDFDEISKKLPSKLIFDGRNLFELQAMKELGFTYYSIGRASI